nr:SDR family oxidoreductase [Planosporangium thailandense]
MVTGATSGIGQVVARELARRGARVLMVARDRVRGRSAVERIRAGVPGARVELLTCDLARLGDVRKLAKAVSDRYDHLDVLVNNAGVSKFSREVTEDGLETTFAVNHLAPFLLTNLLLDRLIAAPRARVVTVSSDVHKQVRSVPWDDLQGEREFKPLQAYNRSKLMNIWFTRVLAARLSGTGVTANCLNPGFVHTGLAREARGAFALFTRLTRPFQKSPEQGAQTAIHLAISPGVTDVTGAYFSNSKAAEPSPLARDDDAARRLWGLSAALCDLPSGL